METLAGGGDCFELVVINCSRPLARVNIPWGVVSIVGMVVTPAHVYKDPLAPPTVNISIPGNKYYYQDAR